MEDNRSGVGRQQQEINIEVTQAPVVLPKKFIGTLKIGSATPSVRNIENWLAKNSAPLNLTDFLEGQEGQTLWILGDGQTTVVHDITKIYTTTLANHLLNADLIYVFQLRAGVWHEIYYGTGGGGGAGAVTSVFGRVGAVVATAGDYTLDKVLAPSVTKVANYPIALTDYVIRVDASGGAIVLTLPTALAGNKHVFIIKRINGGANTVTLQGNGAELIDGSNTAVLSVQYESITVISNGSSWDIV